MSTTLKLPPRAAAPRFGDADCDGLTRLIYHPVSGLVYRNRYRMVLELLSQTGPVTRLLEAGCGSGLLLPSLASWGAPLTAIDAHPHLDQIRRMLQAAHVSDVELRRADVRQLPFRTGSFSHVVCVSVLEHLRDLDAALKELRRVTADDGWLIVGVPTKNIITRCLFACVGYDDSIIHPSSHRDVLRAAEPYWRMERLRVLPWGAPLDMSLYVAAQLQGRAGVADD